MDLIGLAYYWLPIDLVFTNVHSHQNAASLSKVQSLSVMAELKFSEMGSFIHWSRIQCFALVWCLVDLRGISPSFVAILWLEIGFFYVEWGERPIEIFLICLSMRIIYVSINETLIEFRIHHLWFWQFLTSFLWLDVLGIFQW
jgi:hypothetical protein